MFKPQELEGSGLSAGRRRAFARQSAKEYQAGCLRGETSSKVLQAYRERAVEILGVLFIRERDDTIVPKARQIGLALHGSFPSLLKPEVDDVVEIPVGEAWGNRATLRRTGCWPCYHPVFHDARVQPCAAQACHHGIRDAQGDHRAQPFMIDVREISLDIRFVDVPHFARHHVIAQRFSRPMRVPSRPVAKGTRQKILFINGAQNACNGALQEPVLPCRHAQRSGLAMAVGNLDPPHWRCFVLPCFESFHQLFDTLVSVHLKLRDPFSINATCSFAVELPPRFPQEIGRQHVCEGGKAGFGLLLRFRCDLLSCC